MARRVSIPCGELRKKYLDEEKSDADIAKEYGCGGSSVWRRRAECGIPARRRSGARQMKLRAVIDRAILEQLYTKEGKSEKEIGVVVNRDPRTVRRCLLDFGILIRERRTHRSMVSPETLRRMYVTDHRSIGSIAREFKCLHRVVSGLLDEYGIEKRNNRLDRILTKEFLVDRYVDKSLSVKEITKDVGCGEAAVYRRLHRYDIPTREDRSAERGSFLAKCRLEGRRRQLEIKGMLGGRCNICHRDKGALQIHHMWYVPNDIIYDNYSKNRMEYYIDLYDKVVQELERFRLVCGTCHKMIGRIEKCPSEDVTRLLDVVKEMDIMRTAHPTEHGALIRDVKK